MHNNYEEMLHKLLNDRINIKYPDREATFKLNHYKRRKPISYHEKALEILNNRKRELPLTAYRKRIIDSQNKLNYQGEYDRIRSYLSNNSILPPGTIESLEQRKKFLNDLGFGEEDKLKIK